MVLILISKYHCEMANQRCIKVDLKISKYHDNIKFSKSHSWFDVLIFCNHHGFIVKYQNIMIISKYHHDVVYKRYIKDHLIISIKYQNLIVDLIFWCSAIHHSFILEHGNIMIISKCQNLKVDLTSVTNNSHYSHQ